MGTIEQRPNEESDVGSRCDKVTIHLWES